MESYLLRSKFLLEKKEISGLLDALRKKYEIGPAQWHEGDFLKQNGWHYLITTWGELAQVDLGILRDKGLTLLLSQTQMEKLSDKTSQINLREYSLEIISNQENPKRKDSKEKGDDFKIIPCFLGDCD